MAFLKSSWEKPITILGCAFLFLLLLNTAYRLTSLRKHQEAIPVFFVAADSGNYTPSQALSIIQSTKNRVTDGFFNPGFTSFRWWIYLEVNTPKPSWLEIANPHINDIRIYEDQNQQWKEVYVSGDYFPFHKRILDDAGYWYPMQKTGQQRLLVRVDKKGESLNVPINLVTQANLPTYLSEETFFYGIFLGWMVFLLLLNTFLWGSLRDHIHLFYILYLTCSALWVFSHWGLGFKYLWPDNIDFTSKSRPFFSNIAFVFLIELTARFFTMPDARPVFTRALRLVQILLLISSIGLLLSNGSTDNTLLRYGFLATMNIIWIAAIVIVLLCIAKSYRRQKILALFFLAALGFFSVFVLLILLSQYNLGGHWVYFANKYGSPIGLLGESTILSFGLTQRYNLYKKEKEQAQQALEATRREIADKVIQTQEAERNRLARELHDGLGGLLGGIKMGAHYRLKALPQQQEWIAEQLDQAITDLRNIAHDLMPVQLEEQGLDRILEKAINRWNNGENGLLKYSSDIKNRYPLIMEAGIYRIILELLHNIKKHAQATEVMIEIWEETKTQRLTLLVEDNGIGFDPSNTDGLGWKNIRYRVGYMGGKVNIDSGKNGTTVIIEIPLNHERNHHA